MQNDISGLLDFVGKDDLWIARLHDVVAEHLMPALEEFDLDHEDLTDVLGEPWPGVLWGCGFEDFLSRDFGGENVVDLYLKRRGWNETPANQNYFAALRDTPVSLYEVTAVKPGKSMVLKNLIGKPKSITVNEKSASRSLKKWDKIVVRVIAEGDAHVISGALLAFSAEAVEFLYDGLRAVLRKKENSRLQLTTKQLLNCAPIFTTAWLFTTLPSVMSSELPDISNADGDDLMFHDLRFPFAKGASQKDVVACLDKVDGFVSIGWHNWNWLETNSSNSGTGKEILLDTQSEGFKVLGGLELKGKTLLVDVNSAQRAAAVEALITKATGELLKQPLTTIRTVEQMMDEDDDDASVDDADDIPAEIAQQIALQFMDQHYRETLDAPVPALGGKTPRQAVRSKAGKAKVIAWLKKLENNSDKHHNSSIEQYDFGWMWDELGLQGYRK